MMEPKEPIENIEQQPPAFDKMVTPSSCGQGTTTTTSSVRNNTFEVSLEPEDVILRLTVALKEAGCEFRVMEQSKKVS